ncbi:MAG TPA: glycosyltransferase family 39 protein [Thermoanaerobaculia bacterium]|nr:glycosyltransferase family 39 protein [Thermoanaerobaculia bacterium]
MNASPRRDLLVLAVLGALLFLPGLGRRDLWNPDEARYAEVAREMRLAGSWALPRLNGEVYTQKPPLLFWAINLAAFLTGGVGETSTRLPVALAAIGSLLLVYRLGERLFSRRAGWLATLAFATCFRVIWQGRFGQIDMLLSFFVTLAAWFWVRGYTEGRPRLYPLFFLSAGVATLAKGPVGLLPPLLSVLAFLAVTRDKEELKRLRIPLGLLLWAAVVLVWLIPAGIAGGEEYLGQIVFKQNVTRYADPWHHFQPWYYYLTVIPAEFFPWSFLLPTALVIGRRRVSRQGFLFCLCWMIVTVVFFSISPAKRTVYILTMYPAMALMVGAALDRLAESWPRERGWLTWPLGLVAGLSLLIVAALPLAGRGRPEAVPLGGDRLVWMVTAAFLPLFLGAVYAWWAGRSGRVFRSAAALAAGTGLVAVIASLALLPRFDVVKSARGLSRVLLAKMGPGETYAIYPRLDSTFVFYTRRYAVVPEGEAELREYARRPGRVWLLIQRDDLQKLKEPLPLVEVARDADLREGYLLMTRR